jgi:hypothetical protein
MNRVDSKVPSDAYGSGGGAEGYGCFEIGCSCGGGRYVSIDGG